MSLRSKPLLSWFVYFKYSTVTIELSQTNSTGTIFGALITHSCRKQCPFPIPRPRPQTQWGFDRVSAMVYRKTSDLPRHFLLWTLRRFTGGIPDPDHLRTQQPHPPPHSLPFCHNQILQALIPRVRRSSTLIQRYLTDHGYLTYSNEACNALLVLDFCSTAD